MRMRVPRRSLLETLARVAVAAAAVRLRCMHGVPLYLFIFILDLSLAVTGTRLLAMNVVQER